MAEIEPLNDKPTDFSDRLKNVDLRPKPKSLDMSSFDAQRESKLINWTIKYSGGFFKNKRQATYFLAGVSALFFAVSIILFWLSFRVSLKTPAKFRDNTPNPPRFNNMRPRGFTLIELLVVISIISLFASIIMASLQSARMKARDAKRMLDIGEIEKAIDLYVISNNNYPLANTINKYAWGLSGGTVYAVNSVSNDNWYGQGASSGGPVRFWADFEQELAPYIQKLSVDPINTANSDYAYGYAAYFDEYGKPVAVYLDDNTCTVTKSGPGVAYYGYLISRLEIATPRLEKIVQNCWSGGEKYQIIPLELN